jgi:hypothetical protein
MQAPQVQLLHNILDLAEPIVFDDKHRSAERLRVAAPGVTLTSRSCAEIRFCSAELFREMFNC